MSNAPTPKSRAISPAVNLGGKKTAATKCVYFPDEKDIDVLEAFLSKFPRASLSSVITQLVQEFNKSCLALEQGNRCVIINGAKIWI